MKTLLPSEIHRSFELRKSKMGCLVQKTRYEPIRIRTQTELHQAVLHFWKTPRRFPHARESKERGTPRARPETTAAAGCCTQPSARQPRTSAPPNRTLTRPKVCVGSVLQHSPRCTGRVGEVIGLCGVHMRKGGTHSPRTWFALAKSW